MLCQTQLQKAASTFNSVASSKPVSCFHVTIGGMLLVCKHGSSVFHNGFPKSLFEKEVSDECVALICQRVLQFFSGEWQWACACYRGCFITSGDVVTD